MKEMTVFPFRDEGLPGCPVKEKFRLAAVSGFHRTNCGLSGGKKSVTVRVLEND